MLTLEAERARHATTARVKHVHLAPGIRSQHPDTPRRRIRRLLVTVAVKQDRVVRRRRR